MNWLCKLFGHRIKHSGEILFCERCGWARHNPTSVPPPTPPAPKFTLVEQKKVDADTTNLIWDGLNFTTDRTYLLEGFLKIGTYGPRPRIDGTYMEAPHNELDNGSWVSVNNERFFANVGLGTWRWVFTVHMGVGDGGNFYLRAEGVRLDEGHNISLMNETTENHTGDDTFRLRAYPDNILAGTVIRLWEYSKG